MAPMLASPFLEPTTKSQRDGPIRDSSVGLWSNQTDSPNATGPANEKLTIRHTIQSTKVMCLFRVLLISTLNQRH